MNKFNLSYAQRAELALHPIAKKLLFLIQNKKTNLALSADVTSCEQLIELAEKLGDKICILKTHVDILSDFNLSFIKKLKNISKQYEFLIFEDRKFADIGNTVSLQYQGGIYCIADWADLINAHSFPGPGIVQALHSTGLILLANMSAKGCLADKNYVNKTIKMANQFPETVLGFIATQQISTHPGHIHFTPGIQFVKKNDVLGQQYSAPDVAIEKNKTDIIIVGRGILHAKNPVSEAKKYQSAGWEAYLRRVNGQ